MTKKCKRKECGQEFRQYWGKLFCNSECGRKYHQDIARKAREAKLLNDFIEKFKRKPVRNELEEYKNLRNVVRVDKKCSECGDEMKEVTLQRLYCNSNCQNKAFKKRNKGLQGPTEYYGDGYITTTELWLSGDSGMDSISRGARGILAIKLPVKEVKDKSNLISLRDWYLENGIEMTGNLKSVCAINRI